MRNPDLSIVIPTIGEESLYETIRVISTFSYPSIEIIIVIPKKFINSIKIIQTKYPNVIICTSEKSGQVGQRALGFKIAKAKIVMQLDADVILTSIAVRRLYDEIIARDNSYVLAPLMRDKSTFEFNFSKTRSGLGKILADVFHYLVGGLPYGSKKFGNFSSTTCALGINKESTSRQVFTNWLPGGCIIGYKDKLVFDEFYKREGKAYCEDILHSYLRNLKNIKHVLLTDVHVYTNINKQIHQNINDFYKELCARIYVGKKMNANLIKLYIYLFASIIIWFIKKYIFIR